MSDEFLAEYKDLLAQLQRNDKRDINCLSMLAEDNKQRAAAIVDAIEQHILVVPAPVKLPALYVLDSIAKNVREPYTALFARTLPEVFGSVWDSTLPDKRASLSRLFGTWSSVFPADVLDRVKARMAAAAPAPAVQAAQPQILMQQPQQQPLQIVQVPAGYVAPPPVVVTLAPATQLSYSGGGPLQVQMLPPVQMQPVAPQPQIVPVPVPVAIHGMPPPSPPHSTWQQPPPPPRYQQQGVRQRSPSPMAFARQQPPPPPKPGAVPTQLSDLLSSLAQTGIFKGMPAAGSQQNLLDDPALKTTELAPAFIKEAHEGVFAALAQASAQTRSAFLDLAFRRKERQRVGGASSRSWYVTVDDWMTGTVAATEAAQAFGGEEEEDTSVEEPALEPEDPSQPCCAISGEPFDKVYDQEKEGWFYKGARRLEGEEAALHGVPDGSLVKVSALAEADHGPGGAAGAVGAELDASGLAADIAAAAAGAGAAGGSGGGGGFAPPAPAAAAAMDVADGQDKEGADKEDVKWHTVGVKREADAAGEQQPVDPRKRQRG